MTCPSPSPHLQEEIGALSIIPVVSKQCGLFLEGILQLLQTGFFFLNANKYERNEIQ